MYEYFPLLVVGAIIGVFSSIFLLAYAFMKNKKEAIGFDRNMKDGEIIKRLMVYARPHVGSFIFAGVVMLFSVVSFTCQIRKLQKSRPLWRLLPLLLVAS